MKTVLLIAYDFPPSRTSGVYRPLKFAKFLPEFGWRPIVLTVANPPSRTQDASLLVDLPAVVKIVRTCSIEPKRLEQSIFRALFGKTDRTAQAVARPESPAGEPRAASLSSMGWLKQTVLSPLSRFTHDVLYTPDEHIGWLPHSVIRGLRLIEKEKIDLIFSTSPPETNHLIAYRLAMLTSLPWVADFRDPWVDNFTRLHASAARMERERLLEEKVLSRANRIINVGQRFSELSKSTFPQIDSTKHAVLHNGYDESSFEGFDAEAIYAARKQSSLRILNVGTVYENSAFPQFIEGFRKLLDDPAVHGRVKITFVGEMMPLWLPILSQEPIASHVELLGFKPQRETLEMMMGYDLSLLMPSGGHAGTSDKIVPGKLFELMRAGRPILMIGWSGEASEMIISSGIGTFADCREPAQVTTALRELLEAKSSGSLQAKPNWDFIRQFDRRNQSRKLAEQFDLLCQIREPGH